jgi:transposase InsO family protein
MSTTYRVPGALLTEREHSVPLDYAHPGGPRINVFTREVAAPDGAARPSLLFLQGGPGFEATRPTSPPSGWMKRAIEDYRSCSSISAGRSAPRRSGPRSRAGRRRSRPVGRKNSIYITSQSTLAKPAFVERVIGSIRRGRLDHCLILNEAHLRRLLHGYIGYYNTARPHQSLDHNSPQPREVHPPELGCVVSIPQVGGLHHR